MDIIIVIVVVLILVIAACMGTFNNEHYTYKYAKKYATPVKAHLERIKKMENADKVEKIISTYNGINEGIEAIEVHYRISDIKGNQIINEAENRYIQIHGEYLDEYQRKALNRVLDYPEFYSLCLVTALIRYSSEMKRQIECLKTKTAKDKRKEKIANAISLCIDEIMNNGKKEYLAPIFVIGKEFGIDTNINLHMIGGASGLEPETITENPCVLPTELNTSLKPFKQIDDANIRVKTVKSTDYQYFILF